jgi:hypothetical protein
MWRCRWPTHALTLLAGAFVWHAAPASAFECPQAHDRSSAGVIAESPEAIDDLGNLLASGDMENRVEVVARDLKQRYPDADKTDLTNYMVAAYCEAIVQEDMSDVEKSQRLSDFGDRVWQIYSDQGL